MKTNLNEEIQKNLKLMGLLNEAASPSQGLFKILFRDLFGSSLDNAFARIEAKTGQKIARKSIASLEKAIKDGLITRKEATKYIVEAMIASGKSMDDIVSIIAKAPENAEFMKSLNRAAKSGMDQSEVKALVPELKELSDDLVDGLLKRGGFEKIGKEMVDTNKLLADYVAQFPDLFQKNPLFKKGEYKNGAIIAQLQKDINKRFAGKNKAAIADELKKMIEEATAAIKKAPVPEESKQVWYKWLGEKSATLVGDILKAPISKDMVTGEINMFKTTGKYIAALMGVALVTKVAYNVTTTGSATGGVLGTAKSEYDAGKKALKGEPKYEKTLQGFIQYLNKAYGDKGWNDTSKWYIWTPNNDLSLIEVVGLADSSKKKFTYDDGTETYKEVK
jgi:hypothetical protein